MDEIRNQEEKLMLEDATSWVNSKKIDEQQNFQGSHIVLFSFMARCLSVAYCLIS